jgi:hypothetical protein
MWLRSCPVPRHNSVSRGVRELRGERHGKDGRSLLATAAPFFFVLLCAVPVSAQRGGAYVVLGAAASSPLVRDGVATPELRRRAAGVVQSEVRVAPTAAVQAGGGWRVPVRERVALEVEVLWSPAQLGADEDGQRRDLQRIHVLQAALGTTLRLRGGIEAGAGAGVIGYATARQGIFAEGASATPVVRAHAAVVLPGLNGRLAVRAAAHAHRFGTPALRRAGGTDGTVRRYDVGARLRLSGGAP